ncbi:hypothetical protein INR49_028131 [Caranx melampygus]|nr:hypothetical protein INR49_028131 [Caranx melampygus]
MMQLKTGDAAYYHSAEYCRNYTSPPVSYGDSSHYLARLPEHVEASSESLQSPPAAFPTHGLSAPAGTPTNGACAAPRPSTHRPCSGYWTPDYGSNPNSRTPTHNCYPHIKASPNYSTTQLRPSTDGPSSATGASTNAAHLGPPTCRSHTSNSASKHGPHTTTGASTSEPCTSTGAPTVVAPGAGRFPLPPSPLSSPPAPGPDPSQLPPRLPGPALIPAPVSSLLSGHLPAQAAPASEQPLDEGSPLGVEEQEDSLGLEELCKPLYCKLCNVTLNSAQQAQAHYQNHSKKLRNFYAGSQQPPAIRIPEVLDVAGQTALSSGSSDSDAGRQALYKGATRVILATENDYCKLCDASFSSPAVAQAHYQGKNHAKKLRLAEAQQNSSNMEGSSDAAPRRNRKDGRPYYNPRPRQRIPRDLAMCVTPSGQFYCSMCNCGAEQETDFRQHLESKQHKAKVSELRYRHEMENLGYS